MRGLGIASALLETVEASEVEIAKLDASLISPTGAGSVVRVGNPDVCNQAAVRLRPIVATSCRAFLSAPCPGVGPDLSAVRSGYAVVHQVDRIVEACERIAAVTRSQVGVVVGHRDAVQTLVGTRRLHEAGVGRSGRVRQPGLVGAGHSPRLRTLLANQIRSGKPSKVALVRGAGDEDEAGSAGAAARRGWSGVSDAPPALATPNTAGCSIRLWLARSFPALTALAPSLLAAFALGASRLALAARRGIAGPGAIEDTQGATEGQSECPTPRASSAKRGRRGIAASCVHARPLVSVDR